MINSEQGIKMIRSIDDRRYFWGGYVGLKGLITAVLSVSGTREGLRYDGREFYANLYVGQENLWNERTVMRHKDSFQQARELYEEIEKRYREKAKPSDKELADTLVILLDCLK